MDAHGSSRRRWHGLGMVGGALTAAILVGSGVLAQSPSPSPTTSAAATPAPTGTPTGGPRVVRFCDRGGTMGGRPWLGGPQRRPGRQGLGQGLGPQRSGPWERRMGRVPSWPPRSLPRPGDVRMAVDRRATVTSVAGNVLTLATPDGWTRAVDTTSIPLTRDGASITAADVRVGDDVRVGEERGDDGTWTVSAVEVLLAAARGTIASVGTDGFELTTPDGSSLTVRVSDATTWLADCRETAGLEALKVGSMAFVGGTRAADGSIDATEVATFRMDVVRPWRDRGRP